MCALRRFAERGPDKPGGMSHSAGLALHLAANECEICGLGLPLGTEAFVARIGSEAGRDLRPRAPGRPPKQAAGTTAASVLPGQVPLGDVEEMG